MGYCKIEPEMEAKQFKPGQSGNPKGKTKDPDLELRRRVLTRKEAKEFDKLKAKNCDDLELSLITMNKSQLEKAMQLPDLPIFVTAKIRAILMEAKEGKTKTIDEIRQRLLSQARTEPGVQVNVNCNPIASMTDDELEAELRRLRKFD